MIQFHLPIDSDSYPDGWACQLCETEFDGVYPLLHSDIGTICPRCALIELCHDIAKSDRRANNIVNVSPTVLQDATTARLTALAQLLHRFTHLPTDTEDELQQWLDLC